MAIRMEQRTPAMSRSAAWADRRRPAPPARTLSAEILGPRGLAVLMIAAVSAAAVMVATGWGMPGPWLLDWLMPQVP